MIAVNAAKTVYSGTAAADTFQVSAKLSKKFNKNITVDGLAGNDTIQFLGFTNITRDIVFSNVSNVEILQLFDGINKKLVFGTRAADAGFSISEAELIQAYKSRMSEMSEEQLSSVAGGKNDSNKNSACCKNN